jgi:hypothetical protein
LYKIYTFNFKFMFLYITKKGVKFVWGITDTFIVKCKTCKGTKKNTSWCFCSIRFKRLSAAKNTLHADG